MPQDPLRAVLRPRSILVVGASKDPTKRGFRAIERLLADGYPGKIHPVNPKEREILGLACYPSVAEVPGPIDLALVCTPAGTLPEVIEACGRKGVKGAVVLAGGFAEAGEEGRRLQDRMVAIARTYGVRIVGPNTSGIFNTRQRCNLVGFPHLKPGGIGLLSQSGNMALALATEAEASGRIGFGIYVGVGNEADVAFHEYLDHLAQDENTSVIVCYLEGLRQGRAFLDTLDRATREKPVVIFKSGRTGAGRSSAKSHTGALAGDYAVSEGVLRQAGAALVRRSDEIMPVAEALSLLEPLRSRRVVVLADGGGHATIAADALAVQGLELASLSETTRRHLAAILPPAAAVENPVDVAGGTDANPALFADCVRLLLADEAVDGLLITGLYGGYGLRFSTTLAPIELAASERLARLRRELGKPIVVHSLYASLDADRRPAPLVRLREGGIPVHASLETAVRCVQALAEFGEARRRAPLPSPGRPVRRQAAFERVLSACRRERRRVVLEHEARDALAAAGVAMPPARLARDEDEVVAAFRALGGARVAMKIVSRDVIHKSDAGGVRLDLADEAAVRRAFAEILADVRRAVPNPDIAGVLVAPMAEKGGVEVIVGVLRDPQYGPVMMFGLGGVLVEVLKDVAFRALPLGEADPRAMLGEIKARAVLDGVRGAPPVDKEALVRLMLGVSDLCGAFPEIGELDLNPVLAYPEGLAVLDARILLAGGPNVAGRTSP
jgi:acetyltransferase